MDANMVREANELCDSIVASAPESVREALGGNQWLIAIYCSKAYWKFKEDEKPRVLPSEDDIISLFLEGRSLLFIHRYLRAVTIEDATEVLKRKGFKVKDKPSERFEGSVEQSVNTPPDSICKREWEVIEQLLSEGYNAMEVAIHSGRDVKVILKTFLNVAPNAIEFYAQLIQKWYEGRSIDFLCILFNKSRWGICHMLHNMNCAVYTHWVGDFNSQTLTCKIPELVRYGVKNYSHQIPTPMVDLSAGLEDIEEVFEKIKDKPGRTLREVVTMFGRSEVYTAETCHTLKYNVWGDAHANWMDVFKEDYRNARSIIYSVYRLKRSLSDILDAMSEMGISYSYEGLFRNIDVAVNLLTADIDKEEKDIIYQMLRDGYSFMDVADFTHRSLTGLLYKFCGLDGDILRKTATVGLRYKEGKSVKCISYSEELTVGATRCILYGINCGVVKENRDYNIDDEAFEDMDKIDEGKYSADRCYQPVHKTKSGMAEMSYTEVLRRSMQDTGWLTEHALQTMFNCSEEDLKFICKRADYTPVKG